MRRLMLWLAALGVLVLLLYAAALFYLWARQEHLLFAPVPLPADSVLASTPDVQELAVPVPSGVRLSVLQLRLSQPRGVVFFLHGNSGNLATWFVNVDLYRKANFDLVMMDYRGYGKSGGQIESEAQLRADVRAVWAQVMPQYPANVRRVVYGRSLGTGLAAGLSAELSEAGQPPDLTVLVSPYQSMVALATAQYPWVPSAVLRYPLRTDLDMPRIRGPLLLVHGLQDPLIAPRHSDALAAIAAAARPAGPSRVTQLMVAGAAHGDLQDFSAYVDGFFAALAALPEPAPRRP